MIMRDRKGTPLFHLPFSVCNSEIPGVGVIHKFGRVIESASGVTKTIWTSSDTARYTFPTSGLTMSLYSTVATEISSGPYYYNVEIDGLRPDFTEFTEVVSLNGQTGVTLTNSVYRVNDMVCRSNHPTWINTGNLWLGAGSPTGGIPPNRYGHIYPGFGNALMGVYTVPVGKRLEIDLIFPATNQGKEADMTLWVRHNIRPDAILNIAGEFDVFQTGYAVPLNPYLPNPEKTDIEFTGTPGTNDTKMSVLFSGFLIGSEYLHASNL